MTACQTAVMKIQGGQPSTVPGQVAQRVGEGVFDRRVPDDRLGVLTQVVHWSYGTGWGAAYGVAQASLPAPIALSGPLFALVNWTTGSAVGLPAMRLAPPVRQRPAQGTAIELGYHLVYGLGVALAYGALSPRT